MKTEDLRVVMVIQNFYPSIGGAERQAFSVSRALIQQRVSVTVLTSNLQGQSHKQTLDGVSIIRFGQNSFMFMVRSFLWLLKNHASYDAIHVHVLSSHALGACLVARLFKKQVFLKISGNAIVGELAQSMMSLLGMIKLFGVKLLNPHLLVVGDSQLDELRNTPLRGLPVSKVPNGVDLNIFSQRPIQEKELLQKRLGFEGMVFLFVGRFSADKLPLPIFENFLSAFSSMISIHPHISFYCVGMGPLKERYLTLISKYHLERHVHLWDSREDVDNLYQAADVFVLPSISEGLSNALLEAMACGCAVIGSRAPGIIEVLGPKNDKLLFDPMSVEDVKRVLLLVISQKDIRENASWNNTEISKRFSLEKTVKQLIELYKGDSPPCVE